MTNAQPPIKEDCAVVLELSQDGLIQLFISNALFRSERLICDGHLKKPSERFSFVFT